MQYMDQYANQWTTKRHCIKISEYKQLIGGFVENLPGYIFKANEDKFAHHYGGEVRLSPYISSHPFELDM